MTEQASISFQDQPKPRGREDRPWGWFEPLSSGAGYQVKRLHVNPLKRLSLQWHRHRDEQWVVARGTARVVVGEKAYNVGRGQSVSVPRTTSHRIENISSVEPLEIIEVQCGEYLGEDDIVRTEDDFGRATSST